MPLARRIRKIRMGKHPIPICKLTGIKKESTTSFIEEDKLRLVGREAQLQQLLGVSKQVEEGTVRIACLTGAAGIGKTRLAIELARELQSNDWLCLLTACKSYNSRTAFSAWLKPLRSLLGLMGEANEIAAAKKLTNEIRASNFRIFIIFDVNFT